MARSSQRRLTHNIGVLYGLQAVRYVTPLVLVPYLASTLGVATWGVLSLAQGLALYLGTLVEYSFPAMGTRTVAALREDRARLQQVLADVTAAKGLLGTVSLGLALALALGVPEVRAAAGLFGGCAAVAVLQAAAPYWFLNGLERMRLVAGITTAERALGLGLILVLVREPADVWKVPAVQAVLAAGALAAGYGIVGRAYPIRGMSWRRAAGVLRQGWPLFTSVLAVRGYAASGVVLLGLLATPAAAGLYAAAEKIVRAGTGLLQPVTQAVYPRLAYLVRQGLAQGRPVMRQWLGRTVLLGLLLGGAIFLGAPRVVGSVLGPDYAGAVPLLRILAAVPVLVAVSNALGLYWMLQLHMDRAFAGITIAAAVGALVLAAVVIPVHGAAGMAWIATGAEAFIALAMYGWLRRCRHDPLALRDPIEPTR